MIFSPSELLPSLQAQLSRFSSCQRLWVAYSGGCDSHVLLHALVHLKAQIKAQQNSSPLAQTEICAIHINHGLMNEADDWSSHCQETCDALGVELKIVPVDAIPEQGESPEAAARSARYHVFADLLEEGTGLLLAHHEDDQAETLLLQLFRGAGVKGLSAMPEYTAYAKGWLGRPLLGFSRQSLREYAQAEGLQWIEDPSNQELHFDRNFLRQQIVPLLQPRWPALNRCLSRAASHQSEASQLLDELAEIDRQTCISPMAFSGEEALSVVSLNTLSLERRNNLLRYWIRQQGFTPPDRVHLERISREVLAARPEANPQVDWEGATVRRYRDRLFVMSPLPAWDNTMVVPWDLQMPLVLPAKGTQLSLRADVEAGLSQSLPGNGIEVRFRQGGERCRPVGRGHNHNLKKLMQEWDIPPWERDRIPLIYVGGKIAQVVGYCICEPWQTPEGEKGFLVTESRI
ncbi:MAG: tRNA lysidine(34) synthetase TilS [Gammaproteobacteria bacterium]|nr:tRNA lysidine(34) synthetase TilS [Gammaproteobacteria bacterium]